MFVVAVALPTVIVLLLYVSLLIRSLVRNPTLDHLIKLLLLWQTQISGFIAIAAALIGAAVILHQTDIHRRSEKMRRERRADALRTVLPIALMELSNYAARSVVRLSELLARSTTDPIVEPDFRVPQLPDGTLPTLIELITVLDTEHSKPIKTLVGKIQIHHARMRDTRTRAKNDDGNILLRQNVISRMVDAIEIYARCDMLFRYARGDAQTPAVAISRADVAKSVSLLPTCLAEEEELQQEIARRACASQNGIGWPEA